MTAAGCVLAGAVTTRPSASGAQAGRRLVSRVERPTSLSLVEEVEQGKPFLCVFPGCSQRFSAEHYRRSHARSHVRDYPHICHHVECKRAFRRRSELVGHLRSHVEDGPFRCPAENCGRLFRTLANQRSHFRAHTQDKLEWRERSAGSRPGSQDSGPAAPAAQQTALSVQSQLVPAAQRAVVLQLLTVQAVQPVLMLQKPDGRVCTGGRRAGIAAA